MAASARNGCSPRIASPFRRRRPSGFLMTFKDFRPRRGQLQSGSGDAETTARD